MEFRNTQRSQAKLVSLSQCWLTSLFQQALSAENLWKIESSSLGEDADGSSGGEEPAGEALRTAAGQRGGDAAVDSGGGSGMSVHILHAQSIPYSSFPVQPLQSPSIINHNVRETV